ncbi:MAG: DNA polymerase III subunit gamma/tau [Acidobacteria bacterium]|nr:DNA polymerase III subunit gamma/tau [Acidobacteriota bacterium]
MPYQVIARKWRPQAFEEVTGQEHITRTLRNAIAAERLHHAYLFSGARGVGKTTTARLLAKALNCHKAKRPTQTPCKSTDADACPSCAEITEGRSIDVLEIDAASNTQVEKTRDVIINNIGISPSRDRYKVFIVDEVHMLSTASFNALLKTLEEPPPRVVFIMATTESHKIPDTILSRSQQFEFRTIATRKIAERLRLIADAERVEVREDALREIARAGEGSMRDAQSAFDQVISFSEGEIKAEDVEAALGLAGSELRSRVMRAVAGANAKDALAVVDDLVARGHDLRNFCRDLLSHLRDLLVVKVAGAEAGAVDADDAERKGLADEAAGFSESDLVRFFHSLTETEGRLREGAHPRYQLEIGLVKLIEMRRLAPLGQVLERLHALEEALRDGRAAAPATPAPAGGSHGGTGGAAPRGGVGGGGGTTTKPPASRLHEGRADASAPRGDSAPPYAPHASPAHPAARAGAGGGAAANNTGARPAADAPPWDAPAPGERESQAQPSALKLVAPAAAAAAAARDGSAPQAATHAGVVAGGDSVERLKVALEARRKVE